MYLEIWMIGILIGFFAAGLYSTWRYAFENGVISCLEHLEDEGVIVLEEEE